MSKNSKRPRLQKTVASDIAPRQQFAHSSNSSTRTRQIITTAILEPSIPSHSTSNSESPFPPLFDDFPVATDTELEPPAGVEVLKKAQRYPNSVSIFVHFDLEHTNTDIIFNRTHHCLPGRSIVANIWTPASYWKVVVVS